MLSVKYLFDSPVRPPSHPFLKYSAKKGVLLVALVCSRYNCEFRDHFIVLSRSVSFQLAKLYRSNRLSTEKKDVHENLLKSITIAKHALKLDITDGSLWFSLGNSYVQYFMVVSKDVADMKQALK